MDQLPGNSETTVVVDEDGVLARWADWQARGKQCPVAAIATDDEVPMMFVSNEVLVDREERDLTEELVRMGAVVVPERPIPRPPPIGLRPHDQTGEFPMPLRLQFAEPPRVENATATLTELYRRHEAARGTVIVTSEGATQLACLVARYVAEGRGISLNGLGSTEQSLPLATAQESPTQPGGANPFTWPAFSGRTRIVQAWQFVESVRAVAPVAPIVWVAILDGGFWLDGGGVPLTSGGQPSDFGLGVPQINLLDEAANASGTNPNKCGNATCPWHGNNVASAAVAAVGNLSGAAGAGGTVGRPIFFRTRISEDQVFRCLQYCAAWGIDILNMSFSMKRVELFFGTSAWDKAFNFAVANGVVPVAAAGNGDSSNVGQELPDYNVRPATRTPGVITVGALDVNDNATGFSNYGSSVSIWAPGTGIPVGPDGANPLGSTQSGTSFASPIVAGVAAMMRAINPALDALAIRQILIDAGWQGSGRVSKGLDAYVAVVAAMKGKLPADVFEPNNTAASATELLPIGPGGSLTPGFGGFAARSGSDPDYYKFQVTQFSTVTITLDWYQLLSKLHLLLETDDPENSGPADMTRTSTPAIGKITLQGLLAPGTYRVLVGGNADTAYRLNVNRQPATVLPDAFEPNNSFGTATRLIFEPRKGKFGIFTYLLEWGPGSFPATLHSVLSYVTLGSVINADYYELDVPASDAFRIPTVTIANTDVPLDVTLFDSDRNVIGAWNNVRSVDVVPPQKSTCYLKISGTTVNRYMITTRLRADPRAVPGPLQEELELLPKWWGDPEPYAMRETEKYFVVNVGEDRGDGDAIVFARPEEPVRIELLDLAGNVVRESETTRPGRLSVETGGLQTGRYLLKVSREVSQDRVARPIGLRQLPPR